MKTNERIEKILQHLSENMYEREHIIALTLLGALSGTNTFLLGSPGTAKSLISRKVAQAFHQPKYFEYLMNRFSTPEEVFGPVSIKALKEDKYTRKIENYLPNADFAFLDEIWKSSPAILNALLTLVNEKIFKNGDELVHVPLKALVSASNEIPPENQGLEALYDRFILRLIVKPIEDKDNFLNLIGSKPSSSNVDMDPQLLIKEDEWKTWLNEIHEVTFSSEINNVILMIRKLISELPEDQRVYVSDRRWQRAAYLLKAAAFFNGRKEVLLSEIFLLKYCLWNKEENFSKINQIIEKSIGLIGIDSGVETSLLIEQVQKLEKEITNELYYTEDVYATYVIENKEYFKFIFGSNKLEIYVDVTLKGTDTDFNPIDANGNTIKQITCNFKKSGTCTIKPNHLYRYYDDNSAQTPKILYRKGTKKLQVNCRLIEALQQDVDSKLNKFRHALSMVNQCNESYTERFKSIFITDKELTFLLKSIKKQIESLETHIQDCERLKALCDN